MNKMKNHLMKCKSCPVVITKKFSSQPLVKNQDSGEQELFLDRPLESSCRPDNQTQISACISKSNKTAPYNFFDQLKVEENVSIP